MRGMQAALALELRRRVALDAGADVEVVRSERVGGLEPVALLALHQLDGRADARVVDRHLARAVEMLLRRRDLHVPHGIEGRAFLRRDEADLERDAGRRRNGDLQRAGRAVERHVLQVLLGPRVEVAAVDRLQEGLLREVFGQHHDVGVAERGVLEAGVGVEVRVVRAEAVEHLLAVRHAVGEHRVPQVVLVPLAVELLGHGPLGAVVAHLEVADFGIVDDVLREHVVVEPVRMVHHAEERRIAARLRERLAHLARLADRRRDGVLRQGLDQVRLLRAFDDVVDADHVHVHGVGHARRLGVGRDLHAGEHQELAGHLEHLLQLGVCREADLRLAVPLAHLAPAEPFDVGLEAVRVHHLRRPALLRAVPDGHPLVRIVLEAVVVGDGDEVVARVPVRGDGLLRQRAPVRPVRVHVQHAAVPALAVRRQRCGHAASAHAGGQHRSDKLLTSNQIIHSFLFLDYLTASFRRMVPPPRTRSRSNDVPTLDHVPAAGSNRSRANGASAWRVRSFL